MISHSLSWSRHGTHYVFSSCWTIKLFLRSFSFLSPQLRNNRKFAIVSFALSLPCNWVLYNIVWMQQEQQTNHICKCILCHRTSFKNFIVTTLFFRCIISLEASKRQRNITKCSNTYFSFTVLAFFSFTTPMGLDRSLNTAGLFKSSSSEV